MPSPSSKQIRRLTVEVRQSEQEIDFLAWCDLYAKAVLEADRLREHRPVEAA